MNELLKHALEQSINSIIPVVVPVVVSGLIAGLGWLGKQAFTLLGKKIHESNTKVDDYLAGLAVKYAEDKFGAGKADDKLAAATKFLIEKSQSKLTEEQAEALVRAGYQSIFGNLGELKNGQAPLPTARPR